MFQHRMHERKIGVNKNGAMNEDTVRCFSYRTSGDFFTIEENIIGRFVLGGNIKGIEHLYECRADIVEIRVSCRGL